VLQVTNLHSLIDARGFARGACVNRVEASLDVAMFEDSLHEDEQLDEQFVGAETGLLMVKMRGKARLRLILGAILQPWTRVRAKPDRKRSAVLFLLEDIPSSLEATRSL
jgi:hypothetical protein